MSTSKPRKGYRSCVKCGRNRAVRFFKPRGRTCDRCTKSRTRHASRETRLMDTYGITLEEYDQLLAFQDGKCYICQRSPRYNMDVDHDHAMEKVLLGGFSPIVAKRLSIRGLLCKLCNRRILPAARDNVEVLERAIRYLTHPPAFCVIDDPRRHVA